MGGLVTVVLSNPATVANPALFEGETPAGSGTLVTRYTYDEARNRTLRTDAEGRATTWTFDAGGRETTRTLQHETWTAAVCVELGHPEFTRYRLPAGKVTCRCLRMSSFRLTSMRIEEQKLASGKCIYRYFSAAGELTREVHRYGTKIAHLTSFASEAESEETYMVEGKLVGAEAYAAAAGRFPDMPRPRAATPYSQPPHHWERAVARDAWVRAFDQHTAVRSRGSEIDKSCLEVARASPRIAIEHALLQSDIVLGSKGREESRAVLQRLSEAGAIALYFVLDKDTGPELRSCTDVICELPQDSERRRQLLLECDSLSRENGEHGYFDDGQHLTVVRFS